MLSIQVVRLACVHFALLLALSLSPGNSFVSSWCVHSTLASLSLAITLVLSTLMSKLYEAYLSIRRFV